MFASGSPELQPYFEEILLTLSDTIAKVPKKISISGHTDGMPYTRRPDYGNWELSTQRANAARRTLLAAGYPEHQVARVVGYADSALFDPANPLNPINRRIDIVVMNKRAEQDMARQAGGALVPSDEAVPAPPNEQPEVESAEELSVPQPPVQPPRNLFEDAGRPLQRIEL